MTNDPGNRASVSFYVGKDKIYIGNDYGLNIPHVGSTLLKK